MIKWPPTLTSLQGDAPFPQSPVAKPRTLAILFLVPIGTILAISILVCGIALYALRFVELSAE